MCCSLNLQAPKGLQPIGEAIRDIIPHPSANVIITDQVVTVNFGAADHRVDPEAWGQAFQALAWGYGEALRRGLKDVTFTNVTGPCTHDSFIASDGEEKLNLENACQINLRRSGVVRDPLPK